jgi:Acetyl-CoA carboxylase alpha subunit
VKTALLDQLAELLALGEEERIDQRYAKFRRMGRFLDGSVTAA